MGPCTYQRWDHVTTGHTRLFYGRVIPKTLIEVVIAPSSKAWHFEVRITSLSDTTLRTGVPCRDRRWHAK